MKIQDFEIGKTFFAQAGFQWRCTDKGTRTITAIMLEPEKDASWFVGPPYSIDEVVFDEYDMQACYSSTQSMIIDRIANISSHPGFDMDDMSKMMDEMIHSSHYHRKNLMKNDRVGQEGDVLHPYGAVRKDDGWYIKTFEVFSKLYSEMHEDDFVKLSICNEEDLKKRKTEFLK